MTFISLTFSCIKSQVNTRFFQRFLRFSTGLWFPHVLRFRDQNWQAFLFIASCCLLVAGGLCAQETESEMEEVVIYGHDGLYPLRSQSRNSTVLTEDEISVVQKDSLVDVLRGTPGILVSQEGGAGGLTSISIRGGEPNFAVVMLDGVPLNDPTNSRGGSFDFSNLNIHTIERVEILRGSQSALYGSDALSGVINIITKTPKKEPDQSVYLGVGENGYFTAGYQHAGYVQNVGYAVNLGRTVSGEQVEGSRYDGTEFAAKITTELNDGLQFDAGIRHIDSDKTSFPEQSGGPRLALERALDDTSGRDSSFYLSAHQQVSAQWESRLRLDGFNREAEFDSPGIAPFGQVPPNQADSSYTRLGASWVNSFRVIDDLELVFGIEHEREDGDSVGFVDFGALLPTDFELKRELNAAFLNVDYRYADQVNLTASVRGDNYSDGGTEMTRKLGVDWSLYQSSLNVFANWGEGFKQPSFFALGHPLVGNIDLQPEEATSWDLGFHVIPNRLVRVTATFFHNDFSNLIDFDPALFVNVNRAEVETQGIELALNWSVTKNIDLTGQVTSTDIDTGSSGAILTGRPEQNASLLTHYKISDNWSFTANYLWNRGASSSSLFSGMTTFEELERFERLDINLMWRPTEKLDVSAAIDNFLDRENEEAIGFPSPERWLRLAVNLRI